MKTNRQIEKDIELDAVEYAAEKYNFAGKKFVDQSDTGAPDRIFLCPGGHTFFIEFKAPKGSVDPKQIDYHKWLTDLGYKVYVVSSLENAKHIIDLENERLHSA